MRSMLRMSGQTVIMLSRQTIGAFLECSQTCMNFGDAGAKNALKTGIWFFMNTNASFQDACSITSSTEQRFSLALSLCER